MVSPVCKLLVPYYCSENFQRLRKELVKVPLGSLSESRAGKKCKDLPKASVYSIKLAGISEYNRQLFEGNTWFPSTIELVVIVMIMIAIVASLIPSLVSIAIIILFEIMFLVVIALVHLVIPAVAHAHLIILIFRVILVVVFLRSGRRQQPRCASGDPDSHCHDRHPCALFQIPVQFH